MAAAHVVVAFANLLLAFSYLSYLARLSVCFAPEPSASRNRRAEVPRCIHGGRNASSNHSAAARTIAWTRLYSWACSVPCASLHPCAPHGSYTRSCGGPHVHQRRA